MALGRNSVSRVGLSNNQLIDALLNDGWRFKDFSNGPVLSTSFSLASLNPAVGQTIPRPAEIIDYVFDASWAVPTNAAREANQIIALNNAFQAWENVANIGFRKGSSWNTTGFSNNAEIVLHYVPSASIDGFGGYSGTAGEATQTTHHGSLLVAEHGRVHTYIANDSFMRGDSDNPERILDPTTGNASPGGMMLLIHEIGHSLGLKHPHDDGADGDPDLADTNVFLPGVAEGGWNNTGAAGNNGIGLNHMINTVMSYNPAVTTLAGPINNMAAVTSPMALDIAAIQYLYGANYNFNKGNSIYVLTDASWSCIWDVGGTDEIVYNGAFDAVIDLNPATLDNSRTGGGVPSYLKSTTTTAPVGATNWATGGFMIAGDVTNALANVNGVTGVIIENARGGSGNDEITGNGIANKLYGNNGADILRGGGGNDWLEGGDGGDRLDGGLGADTMRGGTGSDVYVVDNAGDIVIEAASAGTDEVRSSVSFTLGANIENLVLTAGIAPATVQPGLLATELATAVNTTVSLALWDNNVTASVMNYIFFGHIAGLTHAIDTDLSVEIIDNVANINGTGNSLNNIIIGNAGNNIIDGRGGADRMAGGMGNDTYHVDSLSDVVREGANAGTDTVIATVTYTLSANVENLTLAGSAAINGTGNALNNIMIGNARNNVLDGLAGADRMAGGLGNDTYHVDSAGDVVIEDGRGGTDTVIATVTHTLAANVENLTLAGFAPINATGNALNNTIIGNTGDNIIRGGAGTDTLFGQAGNDTFVFASAAETGVGATRDIIRDFEDFGDDDTIDLSGFDGTLTFYTAPVFSGALNEVIAVQSGKDVLIRINTTGTTAAEAEILLTNTWLSQINASDFIL